MTDKELLELAARAAGIKYCPEFDGAELDGLLLAGERSASNSSFFNPLTDDGDALRLAVKLGIVVDTGDGVNIMYVMNGIGYHITEYEFSDIIAATRRAIVRAAADIGKNMESV